MSREAHVQFCERLGVGFPGATHLFDGTTRRGDQIKIHMQLSKFGGFSPVPNSTLVTFGLIYSL
jgi:hypothetical protein